MHDEPRLPGYHQCHALRSTSDLTDEDGDMIDSYGYDVFGGLRSGSPGATDWLFTGEQRDSDSGMYYLRARFYDPAIGRFLSQDPLGVGHPYGYAGNNPVNLTDPAGTCPGSCESEFQLWTLPPLPEGPCPVEPMARARCAHARLQVLSQRIRVLRQLMEWLLLEALEARAEIMHRFELCAEAGFMVGAGMVAAGAGVMLKQPMIVYVGATYIVTGYLIYHYYCQTVSHDS